MIVLYGISHGIHGMKIERGEFEIRSGDTKYFISYAHIERRDKFSLYIQFNACNSESGVVYLGGTINISASRVGGYQATWCAAPHGVCTTVAFATNAHNSSLVSVTNFLAEWFDKFEHYVRARLYRGWQSISRSRGAALEGIEVENVDAVSDSSERMFFVKRQREDERLDWETTRKVVLTTYVAYNNKKPYTRRHLRNSLDLVRSSNISWRRSRPASRVDALRFSREIFSSNCIVLSQNRGTLSLIISSSSPSLLNILRYVFISWCYISLCTFYVCTFMLKHTKGNVLSQNKILLLLLPACACSNVRLTEFIENARRKIALKHYVITIVAWQSVPLQCLSSWNK